MTKAYIKRLWNGFKDGLDLIIHPKETVEAIENLISDSFEAIKSGNGEKLHPLQVIF